MGKSQAKLALGTKLKRWNGSEWQDIPGLKKIGGPNQSSTDIDITNHDSDGGFREYTGGLRESGTMSLSGHHYIGNAIQEAVKSDYDNGTISLWRKYYVGTSGKYDSFSAKVSDHSVSDDDDAVAMFSFTLKITGVVTRN